MFGYFALGEIAYGENIADYSTPSEFRKLLANPNAEFVYLVVLEPYDNALGSILDGSPPYGGAAFGEYETPYQGGIQRFYLSDKGYTTTPFDVELPNTYFAPKVDNPYTLDLSLFSGTSESGFSRGSAPGFGSLRIVNGDGDLDDLADMSWRGRKVKIYTGKSDFTFNEFELIFDGVSAGIEVDDAEIVINLSDQSYLLDRLIEHDLYEGTGSYEGFEDLKGTPKPLAYGQLTNIQPILIHSGKLIYQLHDGGIEAISAVRDRGVAILFEEDTDDLENTAPSAGYYNTDLSRGLIRLGSPADGQVTVDCQGDNSGTYVDEYGAILVRILQSRIGVNALEDNLIDKGAFSDLDAVSGLYLTEQTVISDLMDRIINPYGAYWSFTRKGLLTAGILDRPNIEEYTITDFEIDSGGVELVGVYPAVWKQRVGYKPVGLEQNSDDLASSTPDAVRELVSEEYRFLTSEKRAVRSADKNAVERTDYITAYNQTEAQEVLERLVSLYSVERRLFRVSVRKMLFRLYLGSVVKLVYPRFNLGSGQLFIVIGFSEDAETDTTILELWG